MVGYLWLFDLVATFDGRLSPTALYYDECVNVCHNLDVGDLLGCDAEVCSSCLGVVGLFGSERFCWVCLGVRGLLSR